MILRPMGDSLWRRSVGEALDDVVEAHSKGTALVGQAGGTCSYETFGAWTDAIAATLHPRFAGRRIGLFIDDPVVMLAAVFGVLKAGAAYVPLDPGLPAQRLRYMASDAELAAVLHFAAQTPDPEALFPGIPVLGGDAWPAKPERPHGVVPHRAASPDAIAYILYTSGSTGRPKGVAQSHEDVLHNALCRHAPLGLAPEDRVTVFCASGFLASVSNPYSALLAGASVYTCAFRESGPDAIADWLRSSRITAYYSFPSLFRQWAPLVEPASLPELRLVYLGGEAVTQGDATLWRERLSTTARLFVGLNSTETGLTRLFVAERSTALPPSPSVPVGFPVSGVGIRILDGAGDPVPDGEPGEICIESARILAGYWNRPDLTAAAVVSTEAGASPSKEPHRLFRTGDLGRLLPDGCLVHMGRISDSQVKVDGWRIELSEVEGALRACPGVADAAAAVHADASGHGRLVGYVVGPDSESAATLRVALADMLPDYMIPSFLTSMEQLPRLPNGKLDRGALPGPRKDRPRIATVWRAPANGLEQLVAEIFGTILDIGQVGADDSFFDLGGNSIRAAHAIGRLRRELGLTLPLRLMFSHATPAKLAAEVRQGVSNQKRGDV